MDDSARDYFDKRLQELAPLVSTVKQLTDKVAALQTQYEHNSRLRQEAESLLDSTIIEENKYINKDAEHWRKETERYHELFLKAQAQSDKKDDLLLQYHHMLAQRFSTTNGV